MPTVPRLVLAALAATLLGCAAAGPTPRPADFPFHGTGPAPFTLHWCLDRDAERVTAVGLLDVDGLVDRLVDATVEMQGLDAAGRVVSRAAVLTESRAFTGDALWRFTVRLRPTGQEERFTLRVSDYRWKPILGGD